MLSGSAIYRCNAHRNSSEDRKLLLHGSVFGEHALGNVSSPYTVTTCAHCRFYLLEKRAYDTLATACSELAQLQDAIQNGCSIRSADKDECAPVGGREVTVADQTTHADMGSKKSNNFNRVFPFFLAATLIYWSWAFLALPFQTAFLIHWQIPSALLVADILGYILLILEVAALRRKQLLPGTQLILVILCMLPWECTTSLFVSKTMGTLQAYSLLRIPKMFPFLISVQRRSKLLLQVFRKLCVKEGIIVILGIVFLLLLCSHILACGWFALASQKMFGSQITWASKWHWPGNSSGLLPLCASGSLRNICRGIPCTASAGSATATVASGADSSPASALCASPAAAPDPLELLIFFPPPLPRVSTRLSVKRSLSFSKMSMTCR